MRTCVVLPTYNEAGSIREVVAAALAATPDAEVLVVDDNSPDGTGAIADEMASTDARVRVLHRPGKAGLGPAYIAGFHDALARGFEAVIEMDSDLSHDPADVARLIEGARAADVVIGSRYVPGGHTTNWSKARELLSRAASVYARLLLRGRLTDWTSGYRLYRRAVLETLPLDEVHSQGYSFQIEMAWRALMTGFRVVEIPIVFTERREGSSKMSKRIIVEALWSVLRWGLKGKRAPKGAHPRSVSRST